MKSQISNRKPSCSFSRYVYPERPLCRLLSATWWVYENFLVIQKLFVLNPLKPKTAKAWITFEFPVAVWMFSLQTKVWRGTLHWVPGKKVFFYFWPVTALMQSFCITYFPSRGVEESGEICAGKAYANRKQKHINVVDSRTVLKSQRILTNKNSKHCMYFILNGKGAQ